MRACWHTQTHNQAHTHGTEGFLMQMAQRWVAHLLLFYSERSSPARLDNIYCSWGAGVRNSNPAVLTLPMRSYPSGFTLLRDVWEQHCSRGVNVPCHSQSFSMGARNERHRLTVLHVQQQSCQCSQLKHIQFRVASPGNIQPSLWELFIMVKGERELFIMVKREGHTKILYQDSF